MNNSNPGSHTGSMTSVIEDTNPLIDKTGPSTANNTNDATGKHRSKSNRINSTVYIPINRSEKPVEDIVLLPGTEQFVRWSTKPGTNIPSNSLQAAQYSAHYERIINRKTHRSSHHSSRRSKHDSSSSRHTDTHKHRHTHAHAHAPPQSAPDESVARQTYPNLRSEISPGHVISSLEIHVPDMVPTEVLTSPTDDYSEEVFNNPQRSGMAHSDTNLFFPQYDTTTSHGHKRSSRNWDLKSKKLASTGIFTPGLGNRESKPYLWKKVRGSSMPSLALQNVQSANFCSNCQVTTCPNCQQVLQTPIRSSSHEMFGSLSQPPAPLTPQGQPILQPADQSRSSFQSKSNLTLIQTGVRLRHRHSSLTDFGRRSYASFAHDGSQPDVFLTDYRDLNKNIDFLEIEYIIPEDADFESRLSGDKLHTITKLARDVIGKSDKVDDMAKILKEDLDRLLEPSWHVIVGSDSYGSHLASLPGALVNFRIGKWAFLVWQT
uniref:MGC86521 protein n=1 Tax=Xenopus laevis TaxID=8355 RepID=Q66IM9_XENLA|nr:uncharacterized protein LOC447646 [Xenopus laevis]AAH81283.1 MGC86521 protein [Xenopus laevis]